MPAEGAVPAAQPALDLERAALRDRVLAREADPLPVVGVVEARPLLAGRTDGAVILGEAAVPMSR